jgi:putative ABC transport system substrate-binding protein
LIDNPGEPNSEYEAKLLKQEAAKRVITVEESPAAKSGEVLQAAQALEEKKVQAFVKIGDYATVQDLDSIAKVGLAIVIPVISFDADDIKTPGTLAKPGWSYEDDGHAAGELAVKVLKGEAPAMISFLSQSKIDVRFNKATEQAIGFTIPEQVEQKAHKIVS